MQNLTYEAIAKKKQTTDLAEGTLANNIDKTSHFYHVMTRAWGHEAIFNIDIAQYRQRLLNRLCEKMGITVLFSVTMPNHTHEVFMADRWEDIAELIRSTNSQVSRLIRKTRNWKSNRKVFERHTLYVPIKDIANLLYVGKYIYDNPQQLKAEGRTVPFSCFWVFENAHPGPGYNMKLYSSLFDLDIKALLNLYSTNSKKTVLEYANSLARTWPKSQTESVFINKQNS